MDEVKDDESQKYSDIADEFEYNYDPNYLKNAAATPSPIHKKRRMNRNVKSSSPNSRGSHSKEPRQKKSIKK